MKPQAPIPYHNAHIRIAEMLIQAFSGKEPFSSYLKKYFSSNKKHGSKDRKQITALCYGYFRLGSGVIGELNTVQKIELGYSLTQSHQEEAGTGLQKQLQLAAAIFDAATIFPFNRHLSAEIDELSFNLSFLKQPHLFARIRPGNRNTVIKKLKEKNIAFTIADEHCLQVENATQLQHALQIDKEAVIQDYNSQRVANFFGKVLIEPGELVKIWDCCAASGGKSILAIDYFKNTELTVSDKRASILQNLKKRFAAAGIKDYSGLVLDLSKAASRVPGSPFDLIIADVPCSGSGTWARTPEQLSLFSEEKIYAYATLQQNIVQNAIAHLKPSGVLLYVTCSVFQEENEANVRIIATASGLKVLSMAYLKGYGIQADSLFGAILTR